MKKTFWVKLDEFPPIACRLLARVPTPSGGVRAMTAEEIAARSKMTALEINSISWLSSWDDVPFAKVRAFTAACGIDFTNRANIRMHSAYISRGASWKYLQQSPDWKTVYEPMIKAYVNAAKV